MNQATPTIVLTGGGSGGHITPLLSLARELKRRSPDCRIVYIGYKGDDFDSLKQQADFDFLVFISAGKFRRYHGEGLFRRLFDLKTLALNLRDLFRLPGSIANSYRVLGKFSADAVFSKGGFVALPVGIAAWLRRVPLITHDSDTMPGLANKFIGRWAEAHATGMPANHYPYPKGRTTYTGIPIDPRVEKVTPKLQKAAKTALKLPEDSKVILLSGGGNGSQHLNELLISIAPQLLETNLALHLIHVAGRLHESTVKRAYRKLLPKAQQSRVMTLSFSTDFYQLEASADLIISRAGATTLAELEAAGKAVILIPAPFLAGGHQLKNAEAVAAADAGVVLEETVQPDELLAVINELLNDESRRFELAKNLYGLGRPDAAARLAELVLSTVRT